MQVRRERMREAARAGFTTATDFADYLVRLGIPFRDAHAVVGAAVRIAVERGCELKDLSLAELQALDRRIGAGVFESLDVDAALAARNHRGGTAPVRVRAACAEARLRLGKEAAP
jgi:argininosuccinate lyase